MPLAVLCCSDEKCGVVVQAAQGAAALACPRCGKALGARERSGVPPATSGVAPVVLRCAGTSCGLIVRAPLSPGERLTCPRCRCPLAAVAARRTLDLPPPTPRETLPLAGDTRPPVPPPPPPPAPEPVPQKIGRFEIRRFLGEGGFGRVYEAYDVSLKRQVALKVARPERVQTPQHVERFLREARSAGKLMHPHVVAVFDSGRDGALYYIASAFVKGRSLDRVLGEHERGLDVRTAAEVVRKLAEALAYAHRQGVVHRDVKPANVMLREGGEPMLMDFGLAAHHEEGEERLTQGHVAMGTPAYMAPEQARGEASAASDQYSLGVALYEMLTGKLPFAGSSAAHLMVLHETQTPPSPRSLRPDVPRDLEAICLKCLEKDPAARYPDCQALADDLQRARDGRPTVARPIGPLTRGYRLARRNPLLSGAVLLVLLSACVAAVALRNLGAVRTKLQEEHGKEIEQVRSQEEAKRKGGELTQRLTRSEDNLREIGKAIQRFHDAHGFLPPHTLLGPDGKPWHSWRVLILPYLGDDNKYANLYRSYNWSQPASQQKYLSVHIPEEYDCPLILEPRSAESISYTHFAAVTGPGTAFPAAVPIQRTGATLDLEALKGAAGVVRFADVKDSRSHTILVGTVSPARKLHWAVPGDVAVQSSDRRTMPLKPLGHEASFSAPYQFENHSAALFLFADGTTRLVSQKQSVVTLWAASTINGGEVISTALLSVPRPPSDK